MLSVVDLLHVITYPFLLFAAWVLHRRKREDLVSSILSLAILLTIATEQPSAAFLSYVVKFPNGCTGALYDLGNIALLAGILLFPYGRLRPRIVLGFIALLPLLFLLKGDTYRLTFIIFMAACVMTLLWRLRHTEAGDAHQQIKWALFGFAGYALFLSARPGDRHGQAHVAAFGTQILMEVLGGLSFGLAFLCLQLGLLIALMRFRALRCRGGHQPFGELRDDHAGARRGVRRDLGRVEADHPQLHRPELGHRPVVFAAAIATVLINPVQARIQSWSENWFQRDLVKLRTDFPSARATCARPPRWPSSSTTCWRGSRPASAPPDSPP